MSGNTQNRLRIGIFAGTFDPVHSGHIAFALQAMVQADLDEVVFIPERRPRNKPGVEHFAHRVAMLKKAIKPHAQFSVLELVDRQLSVSRTLPQLHALFRGHQIVMIVGSDIVPGMADWAYGKRLLQQTELVVGLRSTHSREGILQLVGDWPAQPRDLILVDSYAADVSSSRIRQALRSDDTAKGLLTSVKQYSRREWLYVSPTAAVKAARS